MFAQHLKLTLRLADPSPCSFRSRPPNLEQRWCCRMTGRTAVPLPFPPFPLLPPPSPLVRDEDDADYRPCRYEGSYSGSGWGHMRAKQNLKENVVRASCRCAFPIQNYRDREATNLPSFPPSSSSLSYCICIWSCPSWQAPLSPQSFLTCTVDHPNSRETSAGLLVLQSKPKLPLTLTSNS